MSAATPARRAGNGRRRHENPRHERGLAAKKRAVLEYIEVWFQQRQNITHNKKGVQV